MAVLSFDVFWRDHGAKAGLKGLSKEAKEAAAKQKEFKAAAVTAGVAAAAAIVGFAKTSVQAYTESQAAQAKLEDAFRRFPALADTNIGALQDLNSALALKTRFDDDATAAAEAQLAQYKLTGRQIQTLIPLVQDYAAKTGQDLGTAATAAGKAILGNGKALKAIGINFKDAGSASANFEQLVGGLRQQVGGFAEVEGKSAAGQAAILANQFGELQEAAGAQLLPVLLQVGHTLLDMVGWVQANQRVVVPLAKTLGVLAVGILAVNKTAAGVKAAGQAWDVLTSSVKSFTAEGGRARKAVSSLGSLMAGPWGAALLAGGVLLAMWAKKQADARQHVDDLRDSLDKQTGALTQNSREIVYNALVQDKLIPKARALGINLADLTDAALGNAQAQERVNAALTAAMAPYAGMTREQQGAAGAALEVSRNVDAVQRAIGGQNAAINDARQSWKDQQEAQVGATGATDAMTAAVQDQTGALKDNNRELTARDQLLGKRDAERNYQQAVDDLTQSVKDNGKTLDTSTEKGRNNGAALDRLAQAATAYKAAIASANGSTAAQNKVQQEAYGKLVATATQLGMTKAQAEKYARAVLGIPQPKPTRPVFDDAAARNKIRALQAQIDGLHGRTVTISVDVAGAAHAARVIRELARSKAGAGFATGGPVFGSGSGDTVPAMLTPGEHVLTKQDVARAGGHAAVFAFRRALRGYASGGPVGPATTYFAAARTTQITVVQNLSAPNYVGSRTELRNALLDIAKSGKLDVILKGRY